METKPFRPSPSTIVLWAVWFGLMGGYIELAAFLLKCNWLDPRNYNTSRHFPWMYPVAGVLVLLPPAAALIILRLIRPAWVSAAIVIGSLCFVSALGVCFRAPISTVACILLAAGIAYQAARFVRTRAETFNRWIKRSLLVLMISVCFTAVAISVGGVSGNRSAESKSISTAKNVVLIVLDTVRADHLSAYGYDKQTSPNLSRIADRGVRFNRAFATAPWTAPSHASMLTGRLASELSVDWDSPLDRRWPTIAEVLRRAGYNTAGFVANTTYCSYETGLDRGFATYEDYDVTAHAILLCSSIVQRTLNFIGTRPRLAHWFEGEASASTRKSAERINHDFLRWEAKQKSGHPYFAFLNYYDAHHPYLTPHQTDDGPTGLRPETAADFGLLRGWWGMDKRKLSAHDAQLAIDGYDHCIAYLDRQIGQLFDELERSGRLNDTVIIVTADHGEDLGEHKLYGHGVSLYRSELQVPLIVVGPREIVPPRRVVDTPVSLRNIATTILSAAGVATDAPSFSGTSLLSIATDVGQVDDVRSDLAAPPEDDPNRGESPVQKGPMRSLVAEGFHYIRNGDGSEELYDIEHDSGETHNLANDEKFTIVLEKLRTQVSR